MPEGKDKLVFIRGTMRGSQVEFSPEPSSMFRVCFNPSEYTVSKRTNYAEAAIPGLDAPLLQFNRGEAGTLAVELLLDTYTYGRQEDVRTAYVDKLETFLLVDRELHAPPPCKVVWGSLEFVGLLEDMEKRYVLFLEDGTPVRARVTLRFKEFVSVAMQLSRTPRSSPDRRKVHLVRRGETLWQLAYEAYGAARYWKVIAEANAIENPRVLTPGKRLVLPPLAPKVGMFAYGP